MRASLLIGFALLAVGCSTSTSDEATSSSDLIGGTVADADAYPATIRIVNNCTVTHIGQNLILTAAHCVRNQDGSVQSSFGPNGRLSVVVRGPAPGARTLTIAKTVVHPRIAHWCRENGCTGTASGQRRDAPDVAVIEVTGGLDDVPTATIAVDASGVGMDVSMIGYGCLTNTWTSDADGQLRGGDTKLVGAQASVHPGGLAATDALETIDASYVITPGPLSATTPGPGLCPGDSGGALYRKGTDLVVGVNASYTFQPGGRVPVSNWDSRTDGATPWGVAAWLESMGAQLSTPCTAELCTPVRDQ